MTTELPPFAPHHVRLCGHTDLGVVQARWRGCLLEIENGPTYGPAALFSVDKVAATTATTAAPPAPGPLLRRWVRMNNKWWLLANNSQSLLQHDGLGVVAIVNDTGWLISSPGGGNGPQRGLVGRERARRWWLEHGASDAPGADFSPHTTLAVAEFNVGGQVVLLDGTAKTVVARMTAGPRLLFGDGTWMYPSALADVADRIICLSGDDGTPF